MFIQNFPTDKALALGATEVRMTDDDKNLYILAVMHNIGHRDAFYVILYTYENILKLLANTQAFQTMPGGDFTLSPDNYNRALVFDLNLATPDSKWNRKG